MAQMVRSSSVTASFKNVFVSWISLGISISCSPASAAAEDSLGASSPFHPAWMCAVPLTLLFCRLLAITFSLFKSLQLALWWALEIQESSSLYVDDFEMYCQPARLYVTILLYHADNIWKLFPFFLFFFLLASLLLLHLSPDQGRPWNSTFFCWQSPEWYMNIREKTKRKDQWNRQSQINQEIFGFLETSHFILHLFTF